MGKKCKLVPTASILMGSIIEKFKVIFVWAYPTFLCPSLGPFMLWQVVIMGFGKGAGIALYASLLNIFPKQAPQPTEGRRDLVLAILKSFETHQKLQLGMGSSWARGDLGPVRDGPRCLPWSSSAMLSEICGVFVGPHCARSL